LIEGRVRDLNNSASQEVRQHMVKCMSVPLKGVQYLRAIRAPVKPGIVAQGLEKKAFQALTEKTALVFSGSSAVGCFSQTRYEISEAALLTNYPIVSHNPLPAPVLHDRDAELQKYLYGIPYRGVEESVQKKGPLGLLQHTCQAFRARFRGGVAV
jgi:hypothetical protein